MKGIQGLVIAAGLAIVGAICNWFYVSNKARDLDKVSYVYVKADAGLRAGDVFKEEHLGRINIPKLYAGDLQKLAVRWQVRNTVVGQRAIRDYPNDRILLLDDLKTTTQKSLAQQLGPNEVAEHVRVDRTFIAANHNPGDMVYFFPPDLTRTQKTKVAPPTGGVGPFRILRIGSRAGSMEVQRNRGYRGSNTNVVVVPLVYTPDERDKTKRDFDKKSQALLKLIEYAGGEGLKVKVQSARQGDGN